MLERDIIIRELDAAGTSRQALYAFGSRAREDARPDSDYDLALLAERPLEPLARWELQERIARALRANVDLVDLRTASTVLKVQVLKDGIVLEEHHPRARAEFEMYALSDYARLQEERRAILDDASQPGWLRG
jgi:uncharacterized protein